MTITDVLTVSFLTACIVALIRRAWPRIDGWWLTAAAAVPAGALVSAGLQWWPVISAWLAANPAVGVPAKGAAAAFVAMGGLDVLRKLAASAAGQTTVDLRGVPSTDAVSVETKELQP